MTETEQRGGGGGSAAASADLLRASVRAHYAEAARAAGRGEAAADFEVLPLAVSGCGCGCGTADSSCCSTASSATAAQLYSVAELSELPPAAVLASLGCGNPIAVAELRPGEVVLDLGSGGGIDVLLSARRVGPSGFAYGVDMTDEMLALAERNAAEQGAVNVGFLKGTVEQVPLPDASVDVVISNCVINLSADKGRVLREAFRLLRPGGRFAVADVVVQGRLPAEVRRDIQQWVGCVAGALEEAEYRSLLLAAGFQHVDVAIAGEYAAGGGGPRAVSPELGDDGGRVVSAFVRATKPAAA
ncbi:MAG TPA: arsenite methyltransferase [Candidatus Binatia bacterium]|nr:arsenite methyltransferase [Candidatus Binatia bacterium]